jgi:N-acetyl sugar amidotransferase
MPDSRPRIVFDEYGVCNACRTAEMKKEIDWAARREEFRSLIEAHRGSGPYDCIVPWSGGKDSSAIAYRLKYDFGLNPLLVTFSPLMPTEVGVHNREALIQAGFDHFMVRPNQKVSRHLARRFFLERGNPKIHWDAGINAVPIQVAVRFNIPLVFYAEHGESEYGGKLLSEEHAKLRDITEVLEHQIGDHPSNWVDETVSEGDLAPYMYPEMDEIGRIGIKALYFAYFFPWDVVDNYNYIKSHIDFRTWPKGRVDGTFTDFDSLDDKIDNLYYYMQMIKFGFGRASRDASRQIYRGRMTRDQALEVARKYDEESPATYFDEHLDYLNLTEPEFYRIVDQHRNPEIWKFESNQWKLRFAPYREQ